MITLTSHSSSMLNILVQIRRPNLQSDLAESRLMRAYLISWTINAVQPHQFLLLLYCVRSEYLRVVHGLRSENTVGNRQQLPGQGHNRYLFASALSYPFKKRP